MATYRDLNFLNVTKYSKVVAFTLSLLEIISTFPEEIALVWPNKLDLMKVVFLVNKYSPLLDTTLSITLDIFTYEAKSCAIQYQILAYWYITGILFSEFILIARTRALWQFNPFVTALLLGAGLEMVALVLYITHETISYTEYPEGPLLRIAGCLPSIQDQDLWPAYMYMILAETGIVFLTLFKWYLEPVDLKRGRLFATMYRDGSLFFAIVLVLSVVNLLVMLFAPQDMSSSMQMPLRVIHSALCTRVLLNLRHASKSTSDGINTDEVARHASLVFNHGTAPLGPDDMDISFDGLDC
ncbi:hypothetical protein L226DRAFT_557906 [Lentinus tigrinus ALCF2SS1-7]|uniref:DUF6533 domain-containing protein n=1 Tax=Lentinus tigrinus ALCF2SS1-6 TaxID=1328759 RepID=A0A5C2SQE1_9APHY|nr:hypothetical protein L227DRAFT_597849 [Lentinus tigrinus ALCF2SS1-6]RPD79262.1 hypothetical protein L226DRAFT_557906 [Lentinus tigrinus ALCF2SS1-7]